MLKIGYKASAEQFGARDLLEFSVAAEQAGFDSIMVSDHFQPWRHNDGHAPYSFSWLGALGERTSRAMIGARAKSDYRLALNFLVLLNVNLAILNMLPIPVLDGGHTVMGLIEGLFRRKIPVKLQEWATTGFAVALISLMLYVTFHDVFGRSDDFVDMYNNEVEIKGPAKPEPATSE